MIVTPELTGLDRLEKNIAPYLRVAVTIPLSVDLRHSMHDGFVLYVGLGTFVPAGRDSPRVVEAMARAIAEHLKTLPPFEVA